MLLIGLTGSIATGKSTTAHLLTSPPYSLPLIDADLLARKAVEPGTWAYRRIVSIFGPTTPDLLLPPDDAACGGQPNGKDGKGRPLNRPALGRRVFGNGAEAVRLRRQLNGVVHPAVRFYMWRSVLYYYLHGHGAVVLDIPLLFESGLDVFVSTAVVVAVSDPQMQMRRLRERDPHLSADEAEKRVQSQTDVREKAKRCEARGPGRGYVLWNDGDKLELEKQLAETMRDIRSRSPGWWGWALLGCPPLMVGVSVWEVWLMWWRRKRVMQERGEEIPKAKL